MNARAPRAPRAPRGPRAPRKNAAKAVVAEIVDETTTAGSDQTPEPVVVLDPADLADLAQLGEEESPRYVARRPFKLNGEKVKPGEPVDVSVIPRWESWIHTGFIALEKATA